jgi:dUTP pyrophosphatase
MVIRIKKLHPDAKIPTRHNSTDAGLDFYALEESVIKPGERALISTGISMALPPGHVALVWDKSGIATKHGVTTLAGVIDEEYRGEYLILMHNLSLHDFDIGKHMKIAQVLIQKVEKPELVEVEDLEDTDRGSGGFGSSGRF